MTSVDQLNNPEYRWHHKTEMSQIMPYYTERKRLGIITLDYEKLRRDNESRIKESVMHELDWNRFKNLIYCIPDNLNKSKKKVSFQPIDRLHFETRDKGFCYLCNSIYHYGSCNVYSSSEKTYKLSHLHHIIPNGDVTDDNIVTLCTHCHQMVHQVMYVAGKWKYERQL